MLLIARKKEKEERKKKPDGKVILCYEFLVCDGSKVCQDLVCLDFGSAGPKAASAGSGAALFRASVGTFSVCSEQQSDDFIHYGCCLVCHMSPPHPHPPTSPLSSSGSFFLFFFFLFLSILPPFICHSVKETKRSVVAKTKKCVVLF